MSALKSPAVNLPQLALRVEAAHFPDPTASRDAPTTGIYFLMIKMLYNLHSCSDSLYIVTIARSDEATCGIPPAANSATTLTQTSGKTLHHMHTVF